MDPALESVKCGLFFSFWIILSSFERGPETIFSKCDKHIFYCDELEYFWNWRSLSYRIDYLGQSILPDSLLMARHIYSAWKEQETTQNYCVAFVFGTCDVFWCFKLNIAYVTTPLIQTLHKDLFWSLAVDIIFPFLKMAECFENVFTITKRLKAYSRRISCQLIHDKHRIYIICTI